MNYGFLIRNDRCIGCHACTTACKSENDVPLGVDRTWVKNVEKGRYPDVRRTFQVTRCNHCAEPPCVEICPVTAMYRRDDGIVEFDPDRCIGCKACMQACPYDAIYIDPSSGTAAKCHFCAHKVEVGLEPACVVVCPEHAIVAGDMDDPDTEISRMLAALDTTVRKPDKGTRPKLFYVDGDEAALTPTATERAPESFAWADVVPVGGTGGGGGTGATGGAKGRTSAGAARPIVIAEGRMAGEMVRNVYSAQHKVPWHWPVPAYLVTKGMGTGIFMVLGLGHLLGLFDWQAPTYLWAGFLSLVFTAVTTALLVLDLERPERFLRILTRPQWRSWLTRGGYLLVTFTLVSAGWWLTELGAAMAWWDETFAATARAWGFALGTPLAGGVAIYTAFLFGQAEGRDLWQSPLLPVHLMIRAFLGGSAALLLLVPLVGPTPAFLRVVTLAFALFLVLDLLVILVGEFGMGHATHDARVAADMILKGKYSGWFWWGTMGVGHAAPLALIPTGQGWAAGLAALMALFGLYAYEHAFVMAPQEVPNS